MVISRETHTLLLFLPIFVFPLITARASLRCNQTCGRNNLSYPFGFSSGCPIRLNCNSPGMMFVNEIFPVQFVKEETIRINLEPQCNRPLGTFENLFTDFFAPASTNTLLVSNCSSEVSSCSIPASTINFGTHLEGLNCSKYSSLSCLFNLTSDGFFNRNDTELNQCKYLFSSISQSLNGSGVSTLDVQVMDLLWWLPGNCSHCSDHADCQKFHTPSGLGHRCQCKHGFIGDGYQDGAGCRKDNGEGNASIVAAVAFVIVWILIPCGLTCCIKRSSRKKQDFEAFLRNHGLLAMQRYNYSQLKKMTHSFNEKLGQGGYGTVYKGKLFDGRLVAVKMLNASKGEEEFINEIATISRTRHVNIVTLLGFCMEGQKRALVYEFMPKGSLDRFTCNRNILNADDHLGWEMMHQIAMGIAQGLEYLHRGCNTRIVHFDIKPHNILLDENLCPKISDFGLAKLCSRRESIISMLEARGTIGYIAPEVFSRNFGQVSYKSDVYSYGMMILDIVGGRKKNAKGSLNSSSETYFPHWLYRSIEQGNGSQLYGELSAEETDVVRKLTLIGLWCIQNNPSDRPSMNKVIEMLQGTSQTLEIPPKPFLSSPPRFPVCSSTLSIDSFIA